MNVKNPRSRTMFVVDKHDLNRLNRKEDLGRIRQDLPGVEGNEQRRNLSSQDEEPRRTLVNHQVNARQARI